MQTKIKFNTEKLSDASQNSNKLLLAMNVFPFVLHRKVIRIMYIPETTLKNSQHRHRIRQAY